VTTVLPPAAILAGGLGTRIRPVGGDVPKVLLPVGGRPFLLLLLDVLRARGVPEAVLCLGHGADAVWETALASPLPVRASREAEPLGTGGAVRLALDLLPATFFLVNGDTLCDAPLDRLLTVHGDGGACATLTVVASDRAAEKGSVDLDAGGRVRGFREKTAQGTGLINAGVYVLEASLFDGLAPGRPASLERELIPEALAAGKPVLSLTTRAPFVDIGLPEDYLRVRDGFGGEGAVQ